MLVILILERMVLGVELFNHIPKKNYLSRGTTKKISLAKTNKLYFLILRNLLLSTTPKMPVRGCYLPFCKLANHL